MLGNIKRFFYFFAAAACLFLMGVLCLGNIQSVKVFADEITNASYFSAKVNNTSYTNGQTVFLNGGQTLDVSFGKPVGNAYSENIYTAEEEIGQFALSDVESRFGLSINGVAVDTARYKLLNLFKIGTFIYSADYATNPDTTKFAEFKYLEMKVDLRNTTYFPTGEYVFTFFNYLEYSGADFATSKTQTFTTTLYIFNTTDYFATENAQSAKTSFNNTRLVSKSDTTYKNYYFFNYTNFNNGTTSGNLLPKLKFDAQKFELDITKTYQGISESVKITYFANGYVVLGNGTQKNFVNVSYNQTTNQMEIIFSDLGDYAIKYNFVFSKDGTSKIALTNDNISAFKQDMLYMFGYQLYYFDINTQQKEEFKVVSGLNGDAAGATGASGVATGETSADVSYLKPYESLWGQTLSAVENDDDILAALSNKTAASTNQPAISTLYNASLVSTNPETGAAVSYFYRLDETTGGWKTDVDGNYIKTTYQNGSFADSGTYLLKVVYNYSNNYNSSGNRATGEFFTQYFYFTITNSKASVMINEIIKGEDGTQVENQLSTNAFTQNSVNVYLSAQSVFNSDVRLVIEGKQHNILNYSVITTLYGSNEEQSHKVSSNFNYRVTLYFGNNKPQISYFTIDNTAFENVEILTAKQSEASAQYYLKGNSVNFFTNSAVTVQWKEKASGAGSKAFYKFIPFKNTGFTTPSSTQFQFDKAIPTNYSLEYNVKNTLAEARFYNAKDINLLTKNYIFSEQGFYIIYLSDSAGNWQYITFCIDKTEINVWQLSVSGGSQTYQTIQKYNVVSADTTLQWGLYKMIKLNINTSKLLEIEDKWVKDVITQKYNSSTDNDIFLSTYDSGELYFAVQISPTVFVQEGTTYHKLNGATSYNISMVKNVNGVNIVNEITYVLYFIDESNPNFEKANTLNQRDFANFASKNYSITMTSDAARADVVFNNSNSSATDYTNLNHTSANLSQAGFTDSYSYNSAFGTYSETLDTRSKYFYSTGTTLTGNVSLLSYLFKANPSSLINVNKVAVYYYPFVINADKNYKLSDTAIETIIFDASSGKDLTTEILTGDFAGYRAFNLNAEYISGSGYQTADGKYVIVRSYTDDSKANVDEYDFMHRENIFIVDRQNIVSTPQNDGTNKSVIGQHIHVNVLDGFVGETSFTNLYMAYYMDSELFKSNKLPLVNYVPIAKYGYLQNEVFKNFDVLKYFYTTTADTEHYYLNRYATEGKTEKSILGASYFGEGTFVTGDFGFGDNLSYISNTSFDLDVFIDFAETENGIRNNVYRSALTNLDGFYVSNLFKNSGYYFVTVTQNYANGNSFPNLRNSFTYVYRIVTQAPQFEFINSGGNVLNSENGTINGQNYNISYTNDNSVVTVSWTDPSDQFMAKIDTSGNNGRSQGIKWWTSADPTPRFINVGSGTAGDTGDIVVNGLSRSFNLDISRMTSGTVLYVYMQYEGGASNPNSNITKALYIDKEAPTAVLNQLIATTSINGISIANFSRQYLDDNNIATTNLKQYNAPTTTGTLAFYSFAVDLTAQNLEKYFKKQNAVNGFFTEGYKYYAKEQTSGESLVVSTIASAKNAFATHTLEISLLGLNAGKYYEIIEEDLAGNITIYLIYFALPMQNNEAVVEYTKPETDIDKATAVNFENLSVAGFDVFAKGNISINNINLYKYDWQIFSINGTTYMASPELESGVFYNITNWANTTTRPGTSKIENILAFSANRNVQKLVLVDSAKNLKYLINIRVTDEVLKFAATSNFEGLAVSGAKFAGGIEILLSTMQVYSWESSRYIKIYDATNNFASNSLIEVKTTIDSADIKYTFKIIEPKVAYKYIFTDNFGVNYVFYHTCGEPVIEDPLVGEVATISVLEDDGSTRLWSVGLNDLTYYYSNVDYYVYINVLFLTYDAASDTFIWQKFNSGTSSTVYGNLVSSGIINSYYECKTSKISSSINYITLFSQESMAGLSNFKGNAIKFEITLVNVNENPSVALDINNVHQDRILINNINPSIKLFDKNNEDKTETLFDGSTIFSGQLTIRFAELAYTNPFMFETKITKQHEGSKEIEITSGNVVDLPGNYIIRTYLKIGDEFVKLKTQGFIISESSNEPYNVTTYNPLTGMWETKKSTGKSFEYNGISYTNHYIVNTEQYKISTNEEQNIEAKELDFVYNSGGTITRFYEISNYGSSSTSINYYKNTIAITYVHTENLITANSFYYTSADGRQEQLSGISSQIVVTTDNQDFSSLTIVYNSYFGIKANTINIHVYYGESGLEYNPIKGVVNNNTNSITISESGTYVIAFSDMAGNSHTFIDNIYGYNSKNYTLTYINGVAFNINNANPIENGVYNNNVKISLPKSLDSLYDAGGKPTINVIRNGTDYTANVVRENSDFIIKQPGYYTVSFSAVINSYNVRKQEYSFTILNSTEGRWSFEYSKFEDYEITSVKKNGKPIDLSAYFDHNSYTIGAGATQQSVKYLKNILISVYDEITGAGEYELSIRTNIGVAKQEFSFKFVIKDTTDVPVKVSIEEGKKTSDKIKISFNAYTLFTNLGDCEVRYDNISSHNIKINQAYIDGLTDYNITKEIEKAGTYFVQVVTDSGKVLYSYKVIKQDPLNAVSIIIIVGSVLAAAGLVVVIVLLRKKMKVK